MHTAISLCCPGCGSSVVRQIDRPGTSRFATETVFYAYECACGHRFCSTREPAAATTSVIHFETPVQDPAAPPRAHAKRRPRRLKR